MAALQFSITCQDMKFTVEECSLEVVPVPVGEGAVGGGRASKLRCKIL